MSAGDGRELMKRTVQKEEESATRGEMGNMRRNGKAADENAGDRRDNQRRRDNNRRKVQEEEEVDARGGKRKLTTK